MSVNPDGSKQSQEVTFSRKSKKTTHPPLLFNNNNVSQAISEKDLGVILDVKLTLEEVVRPLVKNFLRPHLDYSDVLFDQAFNDCFLAKMESIQYNACLAIIGSIRGTSKEKIYQELGIKSFQLRRWYRKLCLFYKDLIPVISTPYTTRHVGNIRLVKTKYNFFKKFFFPAYIIEWNN